MPAHRYTLTATALVEEAALSRTTDLMEAMVAATALVAYADGEMAAAERRRIFAILRDNPAMSVFSRSEIAEEVAAHEANFQFDPEVAQEIAREKVAAVAGQAHACRLVLAACRDLIAADGIAHPSEYRTLADLQVLLRSTDTVTLPRPVPVEKAW